MLGRVGGKGLEQQGVVSFRSVRMAAGELTRDQKRVWREAISNELEGVLSEIARLEHKALLATLRS